MVANLQDLRAGITAACAMVDVHMLGRIWQEIEYQLDVLRATNCAHIEVLLMVCRKLYDRSSVLHESNCIFVILLSVVFNITRNWSNNFGTLLSNIEPEDETALFGLLSACPIHRGSLVLKHLGMLVDQVKTTPRKRKIHRHNVPQKCTQIYSVNAYT